MSEIPTHGSPCPACETGTLQEWRVKRGPQLGKRFYRCDTCDHTHFSEDEGWRAEK